MKTTVEVTDTRLLCANQTEKLHAHIRSVNTRPAQSNPYIVFSHGFSVDGLESHRMFLDFSRELNSRGYSCALFDYYGIGYSDGDYKDFRLTTAVDDLVAMVTQVNGRVTSNGKCIIVGQSLGTAIAVLAEAKLRSNLSGVVLWNLSARIYERYPLLFGDGILTDEAHCLPEKGLVIGKSFMDDARQHDIMGTLESFATPTLLLNSGEDEKADTSLAGIAASKLGTLASRQEIPGANHSFKCQPDLERQAISVSCDWIAALGGARE